LNNNDISFKDTIENEVTDLQAGKRSLIKYNLELIGLHRLFKEDGNYFSWDISYNIEQEAENLTYDFLPPALYYKKS